MQHVKLTCKVDWGNIHVGKKKLQRNCEKQKDNNARTKNIFQCFQQASDKAKMLKQHTSLCLLLEKT